MPKHRSLSGSPEYLLPDRRLISPALLLSGALGSISGMQISGRTRRIAKHPPYKFVVSQGITSGDLIAF